jgi:hypothetical protein
MGGGCLEKRLFVEEVLLDENLVRRLGQPGKDDADL